MTAKRKFRIALAIAALVTIAVVMAYGALPTLSVPPSSVPVGTLAGGTHLEVLSVDAFTRAINQNHGTNGVLQRGHFGPGQSTGWHTHPGPNIVFVVGGSFTLTDEHCNTTTYTTGEGFATGLDAHVAVAGSQGAEFYSLYFLPSDAQVLRTDAISPGCSGH